MQSSQELCNLPYSPQGWSGHRSYGNWEPPLSSHQTPTILSTTTSRHPTPPYPFAPLSSHYQILNKPRYEVDLMKTFSIFGESRQPFQMNCNFKHPKLIQVDCLPFTQMSKAFILLQDLSSGESHLHRGARVRWWQWTTAAYASCSLSHPSLPWHPALAQLALPRHQEIRLPS